MDTTIQPVLTDHLYYGVAISYRAICDIRAGRVARGEADLERALDLLRPALPTRARNTVSVLTELGELALAGDDLDLAATHLAEAVTIARESLGAADPYGPWR